MHVHGFARAERVSPGFFWGKSESIRAYPTGLGPKDCDDARGAGGAEPVAGDRIVTDWGGGWAPMLLHVKEDVDARLDWAGRWRL